ncbi:MAG: hypothetical protein RL077_5194, partial [Verrucomicrobiota bacterium]
MPPLTPELRPVPRRTLILIFFRGLNHFRWSNFHIPRTYIFFQERIHFRVKSDALLFHPKAVPFIRLDYHLV